MTLMKFIKHEPKPPTLAPTVQEKKKKDTKPLKRLAIGIGTTLFLIIGWIALDATINFFRVYTIVKHQPITIKLQAPLEVISIEALEQRTQQEKNIEEITKRAIEAYLNPETATESAQIQSRIFPSDFFDTIWNKESSRGKASSDPTALHMYCRAKGMFNEIGYNPQQKYCFKDREEAELYVAYYLKKNAEGLTKNQALCLWNTGKATDTCPYIGNNMAN